MHLNANESDIFKQEVLEDIGKTLPKDVGLSIKTKDNTHLEITVGNPETSQREAKIFDSKVFDSGASTSEMKSWIGGVSSMGIEKVEVNHKSFELKDANATVLKENLAHIPESSILLSNVKLYPDDQLNIDEKQKYTVKSGDTFSQIAQDHKTTNKDLLEKNEWLIDEKRIEFQEEKILIDTSEKNSKNLDNHHELDDENVVSKTGVTIVNTYDISNKNETQHDTLNSYDTTAKAQEVVANMNLPAHDNSIENSHGMEIGD